MNLTQFKGLLRKIINRSIKVNFQDRSHAKIFHPLSLGCHVVALLLGVLACTPKIEVSPRAIIPSTVISEEGAVFEVRGIRLPGTRQEFLIRKGGGQFWIPLTIIRTLRFLGPSKEGFRPAKIFLISGEGFEAEVSSDMLLEGITDLGYWNIPLQKIQIVEFGTD